MADSDDTRAEHMAEFWDARAREDALHFVDDRLAYDARGGRERSGDEDAWFWSEGERLLEEMLARSGAPPLPADGVALDVGCGVGRFTRAVAGRVREVHGIDVSAEMVGRARAALDGVPGVTLHHGDGTTLRPLPDASVDVVVSFVVFQHIPDPRVTLGYLREIGRVLRPGGWMCVQLSNDPSVHRPRRDLPRPRLRDRLRGRVPKGTDDPAWLGSAVSLDELDAALRDGGLRSVHRSGEGTQYLLERAVKG